jgi:hypothetical protein
MRAGRGRRARPEQLEQACASAEDRRGPRACRVGRGRCPPRAARRRFKLEQASRRRGSPGVPRSPCSADSRRCSQLSKFKLSEFQIEMYAVREGFWFFFFYTRRRSEACGEEMLRRVSLAPSSLACLAGHSMASRTCSVFICFECIQLCYMPRRGEEMLQRDAHAIGFLSWQALTLRGRGWPRFNTAYLIREINWYK